MVKPSEMPRDRSNWRTRRPRGYRYSGFGVMTKPQATKKARDERCWHRKGRPGWEFKSPARVEEVPGGYAVFVGKMKVRRK